MGVKLNKQQQKNLCQFTLLFSYTVILNILNYNINATTLFNFISLFF